jgi:GrpB-like predicted nucleotidyltransferase (UPF0157 family)
MVRISLADYDPVWPKLFAFERERLLSAINEYVAAIEHIGSTAVADLTAKPVIDIMIGVHTLADADIYCIEPITRLGYEYVKSFEKDTPHRRYFRKDDREGTRTHQIHLVEYGSAWWTRHLAFRDYLRSHAEVRDAYAQLKRELASREFETITDYANATTEFINAVESQIVG